MQQGRSPDRCAHAAGAARGSSTTARRSARSTTTRSRARSSASGSIRARRSRGFRKLLLGHAVSRRSPRCASAPAPSRGGRHPAAAARTRCLRPVRHAARDGRAASVRAPAQVLRRASRSSISRSSACCCWAAARRRPCSIRCSARGATACASRRLLVALRGAGARARHGRAVRRRRCAARPRFSPGSASSLALVYAAFSLATINHDAWGAELSTDPVERTRITATREGLALAGVVIASRRARRCSPPATAKRGDSRASRSPSPRSPRFALAVLLRAPRAPRTGDRAPRPSSPGIAAPLADPLFRPLLAVFVANGIAAAIPATLVLFFIADVLQADSGQGLFLALYFVAGAAGMPLWVRLAAALGKSSARGCSRWSSRSRLRLGRVSRRRRHRGVCGDLRALRPRARRRSRVAARRCSPMSSAAAAPAATPAPTSVCGRLPPSSISRWRPESRCRCSRRWATHPVRATPPALAALAIVYAVVPCVLKLAALATLSLVRATLRKDLAMMLKTSLAVLAAAALVGCATVDVAQYAAEKPRLRPRALFQRHDRRLGDVPGPLRQGRQALHRAHRRALGRQPGNARRAFRVLRRREAESRLELVKDGDRYTGTAGDVVGTGTGVQQGNAFNLQLRARAAGRRPDVAHGHGRLDVPDRRAVRC